MTRYDSKYDYGFKSISLALWWAILLGPVGVLYSSVLAGVILILIGIVVVSAKFIFPIILLWLISCVVSVALAERRNQKYLQWILSKEGKSE